MKLLRPWQQHTMIYITRNKLATKLATKKFQFPINSYLWWDARLFKSLNPRHITKPCFSYFANYRAFLLPIIGQNIVCSDSILTVQTIFWTKTCHETCHENYLTLSSPVRKFTTEISKCLHILSSSFRVIFWGDLSLFKYVDLLTPIIFPIWLHDIPPCKIIKLFLIRSLFLCSFVRYTFGIRFPFLY